jgi:sporulation protein YlmC with PRC-barrel domain
MSSTTTTPETPAPVYLSAMLRDAVVDVDGKGIGSLADVIVRLGAAGYPLVTGLVTKVGPNRIFVPISVVTSIVPDRITLGTKTLDLRPFERRDGEVLLKDAVLGHRGIDWSAPSTSPSPTRQPGGQRQDSTSTKEGGSPGANTTNTPRATGTCSTHSSGMKPLRKFARDLVGSAA